jgi:hypothetical protein
VEEPSLQARRNRAISFIGHLRGRLPDGKHPGFRHRPEPGKISGSITTLPEDLNADSAGEQIKNNGLCVFIRTMKTRM